MELLLGLLLLLIVNACVGTSSLFLEHLVDHILDVAGSCFFLYFRPCLHDRILEFDSQLILPQLF